MFITSKGDAFTIMTAAESASDTVVSSVSTAYHTLL